jgi:uncharacterized protein (TIGR00730 family)
MSRPRVCVFAGSQLGVDPEFAVVAGQLGQALAERDIGLVYGGASRGLMGVVADAALAAGGEVVGVLPQSLEHVEIGHSGLSELRVVGSMHERKALMAELSMGFIALPGGLGTFEELFEQMTWSKLGIHAKPVVALNVGGFFDPVVALLDHARRGGFLAVDSADLVTTATSVEEALNRLELAAGFKRSDPKASDSL